MTFMESVQQHAIDVKVTRKKRALNGGSVQIIDSLVSHHMIKSIFPINRYPDTQNQCINNYNLKK